MLASIAASAIAADSLGYHGAAAKNQSLRADGGFKVRHRYGSGGHKSLPTAAAPPTWGEAQQGDNLFDPRNRCHDRNAPMTCFHDLHTQAAAEIVQTFNGLCSPGRRG
jgi:hypothetical protein